MDVHISFFKKYDIQNIPKRVRIDNKLPGSMYEARRNHIKYVQYTVVNPPIGGFCFVDFDDISEIRNKCFVSVGQNHQNVVA